jgi:hypothetical protein
MASQEPLPKDFEAQSRQRFAQIKNPEVTFEQYLKADIQEFQRQKELEKNPKLLYKPGLPQMTPCGNGDFETSLDQTQWQGAYGAVPPGGGTPNFAGFTAGIVGGPITSGTSHQTWVGPGVDPNVGISLTGPLPSGSPSLGAVRIGNQVNGAGCELLSKTFIVPAAQTTFCFWYAVVLEDPQHNPAIQPYFWVRVTDSTGAIVPGAVNFGGGTDKLVADHNNPFFQQKTPSLLYKNWTCTQIKLASQVGRTVTIEFITADCAAGGHFGYAYIDNFCGDCAGSPEGNLSFDSAASSSCGPGKLCFNYSLPKLVTPTGTTTGSITITLGIYQNGVLLTTLVSPTLTSGSGYCFSITPASIPGINTTLGGFDFVATGAFALGSTTLPPMTVGTAPSGRIPGNNNDYQIACKWCCPGDNLLKNGDFEAGNSGFTSQYVFNAATSANATVPGQYNIVNSAGALAISPLWKVSDHFGCIGGTGTSKFMVVNGLTCRTGKTVIWKETVNVVAGKEYRFCANAKHMPQATFDITPKIDVKFTGPPFSGNPNIPPTLVNTGAPVCAWQLISGTVVPTAAGTMAIEIWLDETGLGDGNDLALDDISLQMKPAINPNYVLFSVTPKNITSSQYNVDAMPLNLPSGYGFFWEVCEVNNANTPIAGTVVTNPSAWWTPFPCDFKGYVGTSTLGMLTNPGKFLTGKRYRITFGAWSDCVAWGQSSWYLQYNTALKKVEVVEVKQSAQDLKLPADRGTAVFRT